MNSSLYHRQILSLVELVCTTALKSLFCAPPMYQDFKTCHHCLLKKTIVDLPTKVKENSWKTSCNCWVCRGLRTKITALLHRHYWSGFDCKSATQAKWILETKKGCLHLSLKKTLRATIHRQNLSKNKHYTFSTLWNSSTVDKYWESACKTVEIMYWRLAQRVTM